MVVYTETRRAEHSAVQPFCFCFLGMMNNISEFNTGTHLPQTDIVKGSIPESLQHQKKKRSLPIHLTGPNYKPDTTSLA